MKPVTRAENGCEYLLSECAEVAKPSWKGIAENQMETIWARKKKKKKTEKIGQHLQHWTLLHFTLFFLLLIFILLLFLPSAFLQFIISTRKSLRTYHFQLDVHSSLLSSHVLIRLPCFFLWVKFIPLTDQPSHDCHCHQRQSNYRIRHSWKRYKRNCKWLSAISHTPRNWHDVCSWILQFLAWWSSQVALVL